MLKVMKFQIWRTLQRVIATLILAPITLSEVVLGLWFFDVHGDKPLGIIFAVIFLASSLIGVYLYFRINQEIDGWRFRRGACASG